LVRQSPAAVVPGPPPPRRFRCRRRRRDVSSAGRGGKGEAVEGGAGDVAGRSGDSMDGLWWMMVDGYLYGCYH